MGVYLCVQKLDGTDHPDWQWGMAGDRHLARLIDGPGIQYVEDEWHRPIDFERFENMSETIEDDWVRSRFDTLLRLLKAEPDYWIYVSW